jgi:hypothetical protein
MLNALRLLPASITWLSSGEIRTVRLWLSGAEKALRLLTGSLIRPERNWRCHFFDYASICLFRELRYSCTMAKFGSKCPGFCGWYTFPTRAKTMGEL